jgi:hypothetical protein
MHLRSLSYQRSAFRVRIVVSSTILPTYQDCHDEMGGNISRRAAFCKMIEHACCNYHDGPHVLVGDANVRSASLDGSCSQQASYQGHCKRHHCHTSDSTDSTRQNLPSAQPRSQSSRHHDVLSPGVVRRDCVPRGATKLAVRVRDASITILGIQGRGARLRGLATDPRRPACF